MSAVAKQAIRAKKAKNFRLSDVLWAAEAARVRNDFTSYYWWLDMADALKNK